MRAALALALALTCGLAAAASEPGGRTQAISRVFDAAVARGFAGEVLVGDTAAVWFERAAGLADREAGTPHRTGQLWRWASVSKQVAAALAMREIDAGRLRLDDAAVLHLPELADTPAGRATVRQLLQHTAGLPNPDATPATADGIPAFYQRADIDLQASALAYCRGAAQRAPGERFEYNNCDTLVLAALLARLAGTDYATLVQQRLAGPLKLPSLRLATGAARATTPAYDAAGRRVPQPRLAGFGASAALEGSARDLLAFNRALLAQQFVTPASTQLMWTGEPRLGYVALGAWAFEAPLAGCAAPVRLVERRGDVGGIQVRNVIAPGAGVAVIVFTNLAELAFGEVWQGRGLTHDLLAAALCGTAPR